MALLSPSAPTSPLPRQLLRYVSSGLAAAIRRPAPTITLPSARAPRGADAAASQAQRLLTASGSPTRPGSGGQQVQAAPAVATVARGVVLRGPAPPGPPAQGSGGRTHAVMTAAAAATRVAAMRGPGLPAQGGGGGKVHAVSPAATASALMRGPAAPPSHPAECADGRGGIINATAS